VAQTPKAVSSRKEMQTESSLCPLLTSNGSANQPSHTEQISQNHTPLSSQTPAHLAAWRYRKDLRLTAGVGKGTWEADSNKKAGYLSTQLWSPMP